MRRCRRCGEANPPQARYCMACGGALTEPAAARPSRRFVTVVFADLVGSTVVAQWLDAESFYRLQMRWFGAMRQVLERHGGSVEKFIGDAVVALFGIPRAHEDDPMRAVRAAVEMREVLHDLNRELQVESIALPMRVTVNTGEVFSSDSSVGYALAAGKPVNMAALLQLAAGADEILLGEPTRRLLGDAVVTERLDPLMLKGLHDPVVAHRLLALRSHDRGGAQGGAAGGLSLPLVGRQAELDHLRVAFREAAETGSCRSVLVKGPPGIGKSRLLRELVGELRREATVLTGQCLSYGDGITYWPLVEVLRQAAGARGPSPQTVLAGLEALLAGEEHGAQVVRVLAGLIGPSGTDAIAEPREQAWALRRFFDALGRRTPVVLVIEDIHWAEAGLLELLGHVFPAVRQPMLVLVSARPEFDDRGLPWMLGEQGDVIALGALGPVECEDVLAQLLGGRSMPPALRTRVTATAAGNPLFLAEITRMLVEEAWLEGDDSVHVPLPSSLSVLLTASLDRLPIADRDVLDCASVMGERFTPAAVAALVPPGAIDAEGLDVRLAALARRQLVEPDPLSVTPGAFRFAHALIRDAAYNGLTKLHRAELHECLAGWLETRVEGWAVEDAVIGFHLEQAYRHRVALRPAGEHEAELARRAGRRLTAAGARAFAQEDQPATITLFQRAVALLPVDDPARAAALIDLAHTLDENGKPEDADALVTAEFHASGAPYAAEIHALGRMIQARVRVRLEPGTLEDLRAAADDAAGVVRAADNHHWQALVSYTRAFAASGLGRTSEVVAHQEEAMELERRAGNHQRALGFLSTLASQRVLGTTPASEGLRWCEARLPEVEGHLLAEAGLAAATGVLRAMLGDAESARRLGARSRSLYEEVRMPPTVMSRLFWAEICVLEGDLGGAERQYRESCDALEAAGDRYQLSTFAGLLAGVLADLGRYNEADRYATVSEEATSLEDVQAQSQWRLARALLCAAGGRAEDAVTLAQEAVELIRATEFFTFYADAVLRLANVHLSVGRPGDAVPVLEEAVRLFRRKENVVRAGQAESALSAVVLSTP